MLEIKKLDHLVLTVHDIQKTCTFYHDYLGMTIVQSLEGRVALHFGQQKINLHQLGHEFQPKAKYPTPGSADLCFITDDSVDELLKEFHKKNLPVVLGPIDRNGAEGKIRSIYVRDPDQNLIEISNY